MLFIFNDQCSKCAGLATDLNARGYAWTTVEYTKGDLTLDLLDEIVDGYEGDRGDLVRTHERAWKDSGLVLADLSDDQLKEFILANPIVLQRPIIIADGKVVVARPPQVLWDLLTR